MPPKGLPSESFTWWVPTEQLVYVNFNTAMDNTKVPDASAFDLFLDSTPVPYTSAVWTDEYQLVLHISGNTWVWATPEIGRSTLGGNCFQADGEPALEFDPTVIDRFRPTCIGSAWWYSSDDARAGVTLHFPLAMDTTEPVAFNAMTNVFGGTPITNWVYTWYNEYTLHGTAENVWSKPSEPVYNAKPFFTGDMPTVLGDPASQWSNELLAEIPPPV